MASHPEVPVAPLMDTIKQAVGFGPKLVAPASYAVVVDLGQPDKGIGPTYRSIEHKDQFVESYRQDVHTMWEAFSATVAATPDKPFHGTRELDVLTSEPGPFVFKTYAEVNVRVRAFGSGLVALGLMQQDADKRFKLLGIMGRNAPEWSCADFACLGYGGCTVPLYDSLKGEVLAHILNQNACATVVCDAPSASALIAVKPQVPALQTLVVYGPGADRVLSPLLQVLLFGKVEEVGAKSPASPIPPSASDVFSFVYTSGSTGFPKAALITHRAAVANISSIMHMSDTVKGMEWVRGGEVHMSFLPMAHAMERSVQTLMVVLGGCVGYSQGIREKIMDDIKVLRPTFFPSVPRLLTRIYDKIMSGVHEAGGIKAFIFQTALDAKLQGLAEGYLKHPVWDPLVFHPLKARLGMDRVRIIMTGSAPVAGTVLDFYRAAFGVFVVEGYGSSEMTCIATGTHGHSFTSEHVGGPAPNAEIRLVSVPTMNYLVTDTIHGNQPVIGRGEVCVRGTSIMTEYYRAADATKDALDADGFYHSGDVGVMLPNGTLKIVDRVRNIFKLSIGECAFRPNVFASGIDAAPGLDVAMEKVENQICRAPLVAQAFVHGDSLHAYLVAVVVPDGDTSLPWAKERGIEADSLAALCSNAAFKDAVLKQISMVGRDNGLLGFEIPQKIHLEPVPFGPENILTPTFKMQRSVAKAVYAKVLAEMLGAPA